MRPLASRGIAERLRIVKVLVVVVQNVVGVLQCLTRKALRIESYGSMEVVDGQCSIATAPVQHATLEDGRLVVGLSCYEQIQLGYRIDRTAALRKHISDFF